MSTLTIRRAVPADAETVAAFNSALAAETEGRDLEPAVIIAGVRQVLGDATLGVYYLAEQDGRVVGQLLVTYEFSDWRNGVFWWIQSVYVEPGCRGRGVYRTLHRYVEQAARQSGTACGLRLYVDRKNTRAQEVYRRMGLRPADYLMYEADWCPPIAARGGP